MSDAPTKSQIETQFSQSPSLPGKYSPHNLSSDSRTPRAWLAEGRAFGSLPGRQPKTSLAPEPDASNDDAIFAAPVKASHWRTPGPPEALLIVTRNWLAQMPETLRPQELVRLFPRIANNLSGLWDQPEICATYLNGLLTDTRDGARKGFPKRVTGELAILLRRAETPTTRRDTQQHHVATISRIDAPS